MSHYSGSATNYNLLPVFSVSRSWRNKIHNTANGRIGNDDFSSITIPYSYTAINNEITKKNNIEMDLDRDLIQDVTVSVPNTPESILETIDYDSNVLLTFGHSNSFKTNSLLSPSILAYTDKSNEYSLSLNVECNELVIKSYYINNTAIELFDMDNNVYTSNIRNVISLNHQNIYNSLQLPLKANLQYMVIMKKTKNGPIYKYYVANEGKFYEVHMYESTPTKDSRQINYNTNKSGYKLEDCKLLRYVTEPNNLTTNLQTMNKQIQFMSKNYNFFKKYEFAPLFNHFIQNFLKNESCIDSDDYLDIGSNLKIKIKDMPILKYLNGGNVDVVNDIETTSTDGGPEQYPEQKTELQIARE